MSAIDMVNQPSKDICRLAGSAERQRLQKTYNQANQEIYCEIDKLRTWFRHGPLLWRWAPIMPSIRSSDTLASRVTLASRGSLAAGNQPNLAASFSPSPLVGEGRGGG